jgi:hypothetical protein
MRRAMPWMLGVGVIAIWSLHHFRHFHLIHATH